jgi:hypothetical protein
MMSSRFGSVDGVLVQWGDRLFYPANRIVRAKSDPRLRSGAATQRASALRARIEATMVRRAPQVMVKVTGGGRGMAAIAAHLRYISKNGRLEIEDERGQTVRGKGAVCELVNEWRLSGSLIEDVSPRREAFNIMLSMPRGSADVSLVQRAAREFAQTELRGHKYVMVAHDHQANPHMHISVRAESNSGSRLNPRKADLHRWRETFAEKLRGYGIDTEATRQATRGVTRNYEPIWRTKAREAHRLRSDRPRVKRTPERLLHAGRPRCRGGKSLRPWRCHDVPATATSQRRLTAMSARSSADSIATPTSTWIEMHDASNAVLGGSLHVMAVRSADHFGATQDSLGLERRALTMDSTEEARACVAGPCERRAGDLLRIAPSVC